MEKINENGAETVTSEAVSDLTSKIQTMTRKIGHQVKGLAQKIRTNSPHESVRKTTYRVASTLEGAGFYLEEKDLRTLMSDAGSLVRRHPVKSFLIGIGVGFLLTRGRNR